MVVGSIFVYNSQEPETIHMFMVGWIDKQIGTSIQWNTAQQLQGTFHVTTWIDVNWEKGEKGAGQND